LGKEAVVALHGQGEFFGEGCLNGQTLRLATVEAMTECVITRLDKAAIVTNRIHQVQRRLGSSQGKPPAKNRALDDTKDEADRNPPKVKFVYVLIAGGHCRDGLQGLMDADKVVVHGVKRDRSRVVLDFFENAFVSRVNRRMCICIEVLASGS
jgi:hypothetical protein